VAMFSPLCKKISGEFRGKFCRYLDELVRASELAGFSINASR
jgi:hypothetical protein